MFGLRDQICPPFDSFAPVSGEPRLAFWAEKLVAAVREALHSTAILAVGHGVVTVAGLECLGQVGPAKGPKLGGNRVLGGALFTTPYTPPSSSSVGIPGQIAVDSGNIYICTSTNTWKRAALSSF